jgi:N-acetylmuramoyl-L-alanine amidase
VNRLAAAGFQASGDPCLYGVAAQAAVRAFQDARGLPADGVCDELTWQALVEASWALGSRHLWEQVPNLRGDDVAELQQQLGRLGFDAGRVDGIFGPATARAVTEFQQNMAITADGVCGYETFRALQRLGARVTDGPPIAAVREHERLRSITPSLNRKRVALGQMDDGLAELRRMVGRQLRTAGAAVGEVSTADGSVCAREANTFHADVFLGLRAGQGAPTICYYAVPGFESQGGRHLARLLAEHLFVTLGDCDQPRGMRLPVLRETRMPAVVCELDPDLADEHRAVLAAAITSALRRWVEEPVQTP